MIAKRDQSPADVAEQRIAWWRANSPSYHARRFEIQVHSGNARQNFYFPTWDLVLLVLKTFKPEARNAPDRIIVSDGRDTCIRVLELEKCWYGYRTCVRRGAAVGEIPRGWSTGADSHEV